MELHSQSFSIGSFSLEIEKSEPQISSSELGDLINANFALISTETKKNSKINNSLNIQSHVQYFSFL